MPQPYEWDDTNKGLKVAPSGYDASTQKQAVIDYAHHERHDGCSFEAGVSIATGVAANLSISFKTGAKEVHILFEYSVESKTTFTVREGGSWTTNTGTAVAIINMFRDSATLSQLLEDKTATPAFTATMKVLQDVTSPTGGTVLAALTRKTWVGKNRAQQGSRDSAEIILKANTAYTINLASDDGDKGLAIYMDWYEHTNKG